MTASDKDPAQVNVPSLVDKTFTGVAWSAIGRLFQQGLAIAIQIVLSRLLLPEAFGLVAMLLVFIGFANIFADSGLGAALIQRPEINRRHITTSLTLNLSIGLVFALLLFFSAPLLAQFYSAPQLEPMSRALAISFVLSSIGIVPRALITRQFKFQLLAKADIGASVISGTLAILLAMQGAGVWSLVALTLSLELVRSALLWWWCEWRIRLGFHLTEAKELFGFSFGLLGFNSINYWSRNADSLLIGRIIGSDALGIYNRAYSLMMLPISQINSILSSVLFPAFSSIQDEPMRIARAYIRALGLVALLAFPISLGMFSIADPLIPILFGDQWTQAIPIFRILCWVSLLQVLMNPTGWIFTSLGKTKLMFGWGVFSTLVTVASVAVGASIGTISAVAWTYLAANCFLFFPLYFLISRIITITWTQVFYAVSSPFLCALIMLLAVSLSGYTMPTGWPSLVSMILKVLVGISTYLAAVLFFRVEGYREAYTLIGTRLGTVRDHRLWRILAPRD